MRPHSITVRRCSQVGIRNRVVPYDEDMSTTPTVPGDVSAGEVMRLEQEYVLQNYARYPLVLTRGKGCYVYDTDGKRYLDLLSGIGVNALGHGHPRIVKAIREQSATLIHTSNLYYNEFQGKLAKSICEASGLNRVFFCNSGTEAMEGAIKMIKAHGHRISADKIEIISLENSFHGRSIGALSLTGQPKYRADFEPLLPGVRFAPGNDLTALEQLVSEKTAGIVIEAIQGEGGIYPMGESYLRKARELADRFNAILVFDEIQCGVGRTGTYFAYQLFDPVILPDVMVTAKPIGCGLPIGAIATNERAAKSISPGMHGTTFGGGALACRVALEAMEVIGELLPQINEVGTYFRMKLRDLARKHSSIKEVRGAGLMIGVEFEFPCKHFVQAAFEEGLLINVTHDTVVRMLPPYILTEEQVDRAIDGLTNVFARGPAPA